jgi:hypothetical protein
MKLSNSKSVKTHDLVVKVGEYEEPGGRGEMKGRYRNIGAVFENDGRMFIAINSEVLTMGLNYVANPKRQDKVLLSCFEVKKEDADNNKRGNIGTGGERNEASSDKAADKSKAKGQADFDDEIPF